MKVPSFKRLNKSDYSEEFKGLVETLSVSLNVAIENLHSALNKQLTFGDNIKASTKDVDIVVNASGIPTTNTMFSVDSSLGTIQGLWVIMSQNLVNSNVYPQGGINITFTQSGNLVTVNHVTGLQANNRFRLRILAIGS